MVLVRAPLSATRDAAGSADEAVRLGALEDEAGRIVLVSSIGGGDLSVLERHTLLRVPLYTRGLLSIESE